MRANLPRLTKTRPTKKRLLLGGLALAAAWHAAAMLTPHPQVDMLCDVQEVFRGHPTIRQLRDGDVHMDCRQDGKRVFKLAAGNANQQAMARTLARGVTYAVTARGAEIIGAVRTGKQAKLRQHRFPRVPAYDIEVIDMPAFAETVVMRVPAQPPLSWDTQIIPASPGWVTQVITAP